MLHKKTFLYYVFEYSLKFQVHSYFVKRVEPQLVLV